jgi:hypothetical protein
MDVWWQHAEVGKYSVPMQLRPLVHTFFRSRGLDYVFAASDRPTVIYGSNKKLLYSNLNADEVSDGKVLRFNT